MIDDNLQKLIPTKAELMSFTEDELEQYEERVAICIESGATEWLAKVIAFECVINDRSRHDRAG